MRQLRHMDLILSTRIRLIAILNNKELSLRQQKERKNESR